MLLLQLRFLMFSDSLALRTRVGKLALYCGAMLRYGQMTDAQPAQAAPCSHQEMCQPVCTRISALLIVCVSSCVACHQSPDLN